MMGKDTFSPLRKVVLCIVLIMYSNRLKYLIPFVLMMVQLTAQATVYYSRSNGNWSSVGSWSTVGHASSTNSGTFPATNDTAYIGGGFTVFINANVTTNTIIIGNSGSGVLEYLSSGTFNLTVSSSVTVNSNGTFHYNTGSGPGRTHQFTLNGNLSNAGVVDFDFDSNDLVFFTLGGSTNSTISGNGTFALRSVMMNKTSVNYSVEVLSSTFSTTIGTFSAFIGRWIHNNSGTFDINPTANFQINASVVIEVDAGLVRFANSNTTLTLVGTLIVDGGTVTIGSTAGTIGIRTDQIGTVIPSLTVNSGNLTVYGGINFRSGSGSEPFIFSVNGGTVLLNSGSTGTSGELLKITDVANSAFNMTGGTIVLQKPNLSGGSSIDFDICGTLGTVNVTGGAVQFGNASTAANTVFNFKPYPLINTFPAFIVAGPTVNGTTLQPANASNNTDHMRVLYLHINQGCTFDHRSFSGTVGDEKHLVLTSSNASVAFYNAGTYIPRNGRAVFAGNSSQIIDGTSAQTFYALEMNSSGTVSLNQPVTITNSLILTNGIINSTTTNYPTLAAGATTTVGTANSYISGPMMYQMAATGPLILNFPIGAGGRWRPNVLNVTHSNTSSASYFCQLVNSPASALSFTLPGTLSRVSGVRYYQFVRTGASNFTSATMQIYYDTDDGVTQASTLRVAQASGSNWLNQGGTGTANGTGTITSASFNAFTSIYALGNSTGGSNPLPVELLSFTATRTGKEVLLKWATASELNNERFILLRSSDGVFFDPIGEVAGAGTTSTLNEYSFTDQRPLAGFNFYRLRQIDFDGTFTESATRSVRIIEDEVVIYPSLSNGKNVRIKMPSGFTSGNVVVYSVEGKIISQLVVESGASEQTLPDMNPGMYRALISVDGEDTIKPIMVTD